MSGGDGGDGGGLVPALVIVVAGGAAIAGATQTNQTAAILAFAGAIIVALIAAVTAGRRQVRALRAERERQSDRLAHERQLQDVEHLREFLDEASAAFEDAHMALSELATDLLSPGRSPGLHEAAARAAMGIKVMRRRVALRFPPEHPVGAAYGEIDQAVDARVLYLFGLLDRLGGGETMTPDEDTHDNGLRDNAGVAFGKYATAARDEAGAGVATTPGAARVPV